MTTTHYAGEQVSATVDSEVSSPHSDHPMANNNNSNSNSNNNNVVYHDTTTQTRVRFMCSFGGKILPRPHDNQLRYVGGDTRIVSVPRHNTTFSALLNKLSKFSGTTDICVKYQLPNEDLDALITVTSDEDVENMMDEFDRLAHTHKTTRLRIFLFLTETSLSRASSISSLLDGSVKREHWFLDALNGGRTLDRGRSEVSSIVSEVPDYLFGLDNPDDSKLKTRPMVNDNISVSDPDSPAPRISSPYCSTSSTLGPTIPPTGPTGLRPVKTKLDNPGPIVSEPKETVTEHFVEASDPIIMKQTDYAGQPVYYMHPNSAPAPMQEMPVYYMQPGLIPQENIQAQPVPIRAPYGPQFIGPPGPLLHPQVSNMDQVLMRPVSGGEAYDVMGRSGGESVQPVYYGPRYIGVPSYPGMILPSVEDIKQPGPEAKMCRAPQ
ncbi:uncharacterized protein LOC143533167 [Bidens hawaiensis]|uniref:uncharacterized protein LOC143533167 n=1 Tax=Bidens hawaiensis TaxID=980011 RepID=UPI00404A21BC